MTFLLQALIALFPSIIGPVVCMVLLKIGFLNSLNKPIDNNLVLKDGKRLFGDNKTIRGFITYIFSTVIISIMWGFLCEKITFLNNNNLLYQVYKNELVFNLSIGFLFGCAYAIFELPNSFLKRRFDVSDSNRKDLKKLKRFVFRIFDLIDSAIGCVLVLAIYCKMTILQYILLVMLGGILHYVIVAILYMLKIKKQR